MKFNDDFLDALAVVSFVIGIMNYEENLTQSDKDDIMKGLDEQTAAILEKLESDLNAQNDMLAYQNTMLEHILSKLEESE
jgi:hypothetical protein